MHIFAKTVKGSIHFVKELCSIQTQIMPVKMILTLPVFCWYETPVYDCLELTV